MAPEPRTISSYPHRQIGQSAVADDGKRNAVLDFPCIADEVGRECLSRNLATWLRDIPKPVGVFAANDSIGEGVLLCCADLGLSVPDDVAVIGDWRVAKALEYIRLHVCSGIGPDEVARVMGVSRRGADKAFRKAAERTILDEIHAVRLAAACDMLERGMRPEIVAMNCGYASVNDFRRIPALCAMGPRFGADGRSAPTRSVLVSPRRLRS